MKKEIFADNYTSELVHIDTEKQLNDELTHYPPPPRSSCFVRRLPDSLTFEGGATLPYSGMVVWDLLVTSGGLGPGPQSTGR